MLSLYQIRISLQLVNPLFPNEDSPGLYTSACFSIKIYLSIWEKERDAAVFSYFFQDTSIVTSFPEQAFQGKNKYQCILQEKNSLDLKSYCFTFYEHVLYREICS